MDHLTARPHSFFTRQLCDEHVSFSKDEEGFRRHWSSLSFFPLLSIPHPSLLGENAFEYWVNILSQLQVDFWESMLFCSCVKIIWITSFLRKSKSGAWNLDLTTAILWNLGVHIFIAVFGWIQLAIWKNAENKQSTFELRWPTDLILLSIRAFLRFLSSSAQRLPLTLRKLRQHHTKVL